MPDARTADPVELPRKLQARGVRDVGRGSNIFVSLTPPDIPAGTSDRAVAPLTVSFDSHSGDAIRTKPDRYSLETYVDAGEFPDNSRLIFPVKP